MANALTGIRYVAQPLAQLAPEANAAGSSLPVWIWPVLLVAVALVGGAMYYVGRKHGAGQSSSGMQTAGRWVLSKATDPSGRRLNATSYSTAELFRQLDHWYSSLGQQPEETSAPPQETEMAADLELARDFQLAYLERPYPDIPQTHFEGRLRLDFYHRYQPALALGGDFFDIIPLAPDTAGVFVADVMGHGARSALITAILRTILRDLHGQGRNAPHYVSEVNRELCEVMRTFPQPLFASAFYFVPDTTSRMATFSTAGHPSPFYLHRSVGRVSRLDVPAPHGAALGIIPKEEYTGGKVRLVDRDVFIFFTDGLYEAANEEGEEFGLARMEKVIRANLYKDHRLIVDALMKAVQDFMGDAPVNDDLCVVSVDVTTKVREEEKEEEKKA